MNTLSFAAIAAVLCFAGSAFADDGNDQNSNDCHNNGLKCDAGGPYKVNAAAGTTVVHLDGTGSSGATSWHWTTSCPDSTFDDATLPAPTLTIPNDSGCGLECGVQLTVSNGNNTKTCCASIKIKDKTAPTLTCPPNAKLFCGGDTSPDALGFPTVTDNCDPNPTVTYHDKIHWEECGANRFDHTIKRKWKAVDHNCNVSTCYQVIDVIKVVAALDAAPGHCPNNFSLGTCGNFPITLVGSANFDVTDVNLCSVRLELEDCVGDPVHPVDVQFGDVTSPFFPTEACGCAVSGPDGNLDVTFLFKKSKMIEKLGLCNLPKGTLVHVVLSGKLHCNGCKFIATDCIRIN